MSSRIVRISPLSRVSSVWSAIDSSDLAAGTPADMRVASCRVKMVTWFFEGRVVWKKPRLPFFSPMTFSVMSMG